MLQASIREHSGQADVLDSHSDGANAPIGDAGVTSEAKHSRSGSWEVKVRVRDVSKIRNAELGTDLEGIDVIGRATHP